MANAEESSNTDIIFRGIDGNECEAFVVAIRDLAFAKDKDEDPNWMLRYATTRLRHKALRWHAKLEPSIRKDWDLFVQALFEEYCLVEEQDESGMPTPVWTSTTFSPAPSIITLPRNDRHLTTAEPAGSETAQFAPLGGELVPLPRVYDPPRPGYQIGRLLVAYTEGQPGPHYISTSKRATSDVREALIVTFIPSSKPHPIGCFNCDNQKLGVSLCAPDNSDLHPLTGGSSSDDPIFLYSSQWISDIWSIASDGTLSATLSELVRNSESRGSYIHSEYYSTTAVYVVISGASILFAKDYSTPHATYPKSGLPIVRARIVFEPL
ncbi:hypothetical protein M407DRAFT_19743 [Tulasnella calospora MUT 4182]|uniref:Uncharacterized protein n=1 Tax=Tulasnella calospora MUT 4182 TaxID=1051891 RepID=A0A0C3QRL1_9AGAM|nr:hypothetical protein M407DRAFT_19743 [Tulasnella calospora MUT 4182]